MNKIKLVLSDLHISKGTTLEDGSPNLLEDFLYDRDLMDFLGWFSSNEYRKCEVELIFNGDFLNTLQVDYRERFPEVITERVALEKVREIIKGHQGIFEALRDFVHTPNHTLTILPGNHDPAFLWPAVRDFFGSYLDSDVRFPILCYRFDGFHIEHGNQYSAVNAYEPDKFFIHRAGKEPILNLPWGSHFIIGYLNKIKRFRNYVDKVKPLRSYLRWALFNDPFFGWPAILRLVSFFLQTRLRPGLLNWRELHHTMRILADGIRFKLDLQSPARDILFNSSGIHTVIMGHTHTYVHRRFRADKEYFNTGTWNDIIFLDIQNLGRRRKLTFVLIEYPETGRPRAKLYEWKGISRFFVPVEY